MIAAFEIGATSISRRKPNSRSQTSERAVREELDSLSFVPEDVRLERAAVDAAQEEARQCLRGCRFVEIRGAREPVVAEVGPYPLDGDVEIRPACEEEERCREPARQLDGGKVPTLVVAARQRAADQARVLGPELGRPLLGPEDIARTVR
jgi:hypothetical protein